MLLHSMLEAIKSGDYLKCAILLRSVKDIDAETKYEFVETNCLLWSVTHNQVEIARLLLDAGATVNTFDRNRYHILHTATSKKSVAMVKLLIEYGADIEAQDVNMWTPLMSASFFGFTEIVEELVKSGANVNAKDSNKMTALTLAKTEEIKNILAKG